MSGVVIGTAGHIDHGKTALVRALTGVDTDRLKEEKARGITIELGFAELAREGGPSMGVVDVPGHEGFIRAMVAGATGVDVALLVVAADEGVMPQTREHLSILTILGIPSLVVALTKCDIPDPEWIELVEGEVRDLVSGTRYEGAPILRTSAREGTGIDELAGTLAAVAQGVERPEEEDLARLPLDRVFTLRGTGTVVTGTLWTGRLAVGDRVRVLPQGLEARVRSIETHGRSVPRVGAGARTAVALTGDGADRTVVARGATLVLADVPWQPSRMLTVLATLLPDAGWALERNQRVHVHLGTAQVLARCVILEREALAPGEQGWVQLRLEEPLVARTRDRLVLRAYSPVTTIGGGVVAESQPTKRVRVDAGTVEYLRALVEGDATVALEGGLALAGWAGVALGEAPILLGFRPAEVEEALARRAPGGHDPVVVGGRAFASGIGERAETLILEAVSLGHERDPLREAVPMAEVRAALPPWAPRPLADAVVRDLLARGRIEGVEGGVRTRGWSVALSEDQATASSELTRLYLEAGLAPPLIDELPAELRARADLNPLLRRLESGGLVRSVSEGLYFSGAALEEAVRRVQDGLSGREGLGPADFREVLPVTRKHLMPLLGYLDGAGVTVRSGTGRAVPAFPPEGGPRS